MAALLCACCAGCTRSDSSAGGNLDAGIGSQHAGQPSIAPPETSTRACDDSSECGFGEIDHEITGSKDCVCLYGCPYSPLNKQTIERRKAGYAEYCDSAHDGQGERCGIDDCVPLTTAVCDQHECRATPR
jgi:hypothetical protein